MAYNPQTTSQELAAQRAAEMNTWLIKWLIGLPALGLAILAWRFLALFAINEATSAGEGLSMMLLSAVYILAVAGIPSLCAMIEHARPQEAHAARGVWIAIFVLSAVGIAAYGLATFPRNDHAMTMLGALGSAAGSGILGRWAVLGIAQSYRFAHGETTQQPLPEPAQPVQPQTGGGEGAIRPDDVFQAWVEHRQKPGGKMQAQAAYADYVEACTMNGVEPMSQKSFGDTLTRIVEGSGGRFAKFKSNGLIVYQGWEIPGHSAPEYADFEQHAP